ncbi:tRNA (adenosine(37)-N6)-dimethylallyltransferase MiaA [bacterium]|nr:tRNA (adenosine(37)-N6)-dimethylallyltransferase MiaA [bacterium]
MSDTPPDVCALFRSSVYLTGPTGVGKTDISLRLAEELDAEILALDAMTLYRGMDIGTAKPGKAQTGRIRHHLIDLVSPQDESSLDLYLKAATEVLVSLAKSGKKALFVGGSPLYLKACLRGLSELPPRNDLIREDLERQAAAEGVTKLYQRLTEVDPATASKVAGTDLRRIVRALEIHAATGTAPSQLRGKHETPAPPTVPVVAILRDRRSLYDRIDRRVEDMFEQGLIDEARSLPQPLSRSARQAVGYSEAFEVLEGRMTIEAAIERTQLRTRHYAKHQLTWFRRLEEVRGLNIEDQSETLVLDRLMKHIESTRAGFEPTGDPIL